MLYILFFSWTTHFCCNVVISIPFLHEQHWWIPIFHSVPMRELDHLRSEQISSNHWAYSPTHLSPLTHSSVIWHSDILHQGQPWRWRCTLEIETAWVRFVFIVYYTFHPNILSQIQTRKANGPFLMNLRVSIMVSPIAIVLVCCVLTYDQVENHGNAVASSPFASSAVRPDARGMWLIIFKRS